MGEGKSRRVSVLGSGSLLAPAEWIKVLRRTPSRNEAEGRGAWQALLLGAVVLGEACLCALIILKVAYTEIDWVAYMQEVQGFLLGERDYSLLRGDTGPLVYPAGFVYVYSGLFHLCDEGRDVRLAQWIFLGLYVSLMGLVLAIYRRAGRTSLPLYCGLLTALSRRVHSIFVLRLFNDGVAMWLLYLAVLLFLHHRWRWGCLWFSLAVGVKMNILLFAPGLLLLLLQCTGVVETAVCLSICASVQLLLGAPFLLTFPVQYLSKAFELNRVFEHKWTVNFKFLAEETFVSPRVSVLLLVCTALSLVLFAVKWVREAQAQQVAGRAGATLQPLYIAKTLFVSNFLGVAFSRTLHFQFYVWYLHSLPLLLWTTALPVPLCLAVLGGVEVAFNSFPASAESSLLLQVCHLTLVAALALAPVFPAGEEGEEERKQGGGDGEEEEEEEEEEKEKATGSTHIKSS